MSETSKYFIFLSVFGTKVAIKSEYAQAACQIIYVPRTPALRISIGEKPVCRLK